MSYLDSLSYHRHLYPNLVPFPQDPSLVYWHRQRPKHHGCPWFWNRNVYRESVKIIFYSSANRVTVNSFYCGQLSLWSRSMLWLSSMKNEESLLKYLCCIDLINNWPSPADSGGNNDYTGCFNIWLYILPRFRYWPPRKITVCRPHRLEMVN